MAKGGARARSGPAPDPLAQVRDRPSDEAGWTTLPATGREGDVPDWPLSPPTVSVSVPESEGGGYRELVLESVQERELAVWEGEWSRPQAVMWERNGQELEVAMYVRALVAAEDVGAKTPARVLVKQLQEALGLSIPGLLRNRWKIEAVEDKVEQVAPARSGLTVVQGGA